MLSRKQILLLVPIVLIVACTFGLVREIRGPNAHTAYRWVFDEPVPEYVTLLESNYHSHMKGYGLYLGFSVPTNKLDAIVAIESSVPLYHSDSDTRELWSQEDKFSEMFPEDEFNVELLRMSGRANESSVQGEACTIVYNPETGRVYCYYLNDSDLVSD